MITQLERKRVTTKPICWLRTETIVIIALLLGRVVLLLASPAELSGDAHGYVSAAQHILATGQLPPLRVQPHGLSVLLAPLLAVSGSAIADAVLWAQVAMDTAVVVTLLLFVRRFFAGPQFALLRSVACLTIIVQPFTATMISSVYTEQVCQFLIFFGVMSLHFSASSKPMPLIPITGPLVLGLAGILRTELLALNLAILLAVLALHINSYKPWTRCLRHGVVMVALYAMLPCIMVGFQYASTGEVGLVKSKFHNPGYMAWMRTWFAFSHSQYDRFAFGPGKPDWPGFDAAAYPDRAFDTSEERQRVDELLQRWREAGYTVAVDQEFKELGEAKAQHNSLRHYLLIPMIRMCHFWVNFDGAQTILRTLPLKPPASTVVVGLTLLLRGGFLILGLVGFYAVWFRYSYLRCLGATVNLFRLASVAVFLRTLELGVLGAFVWAGLMEVRYVVVVFPLLILLSLGGLIYVTYARPAGVGRHLANVEANAPDSQRRYGF